MATLVLSVVGTLVGGPVGGAIGALVGRQADALLFRPGARQGPRLRELAITTSSYGTAIPKHFGRMRVPGTIIWATDLSERREKHGGGKGKPKYYTYSYSNSFAVALSSRPIAGIGRIWADGSLLRGAAGDLKVPGTFRFHTGHGDQQPDPLISAAEGAADCPAFRGLAYAVFENLQLADFGNRIPSLSFEVFADEGDLDLAVIADGAIAGIDANVPLPGLVGYSSEGSLLDALATLDPVYPMDCDAGGTSLVLVPERLQQAPLVLGEPALAGDDASFGGAQGFARQRAPIRPDRPGLIRYYDLDREYQPGVQRAAGRPEPGQPGAIELPAALAAGDALALVEQAARRTLAARETVSWRTSSLDPAIGPGSVVRLPQEPGLWRVMEWEWRMAGVELSLTRLPAGETATGLSSDPGRALTASDLLAGATVLAVFELPWDGSNGSGDTPEIYAAVSRSGGSWSGAALYVDHGDGQLLSLGVSGRTGAVMGTALAPLLPASAAIVDRTSYLDVQLANPAATLVSATLRQLALGANRALIGSEIIQFATATPLGNNVWRLEQILRGRGGTEAAAAGHGAGEQFVLLDDSLVALDAALVGQSPAAVIAAVGMGDDEPVTAPIASRGATWRPLAPVHPRATPLASGGLHLAWTRRARGAWLWNDGVDAPLHEQSEAYQVGYGPITSPLALWDVTTAELIIAQSVLTQLASSLPGGKFHVRQRGSYALSDPLLLATVV